jgi:hemerythrin-like domain-containing protein
MADRMLNEATQKEISNKFEKIEDEVIGHGIHEKYHELLVQLKQKYQ